MIIHEYSREHEIPPHYDEKFRIWLEPFIPDIKSNSTVTSIKPSVANKYEGDIYGLFNLLGIPKEIHYIAMLVNGYRNSGDYDGTIVGIYIPDTSQVNLLISLYSSVKDKL